MEQPIGMIMRMLLEGQITINQARGIAGMEPLKETGADRVSP
ncbi:hypothetical protein [Paenibacillus sp. FJAT-26967]|nr:hypothetical protein [Paenibacillus sp. FJAT-26967]